ncbi:hypothetical protein CEXT_629691 [Caerostris extrusa]|uniref:Uncharacterized protein n=1 Tax=Caerostris extrusa TaxID=172846 RepID=A0AAV4Y9F6_CAEEX|nr:hypothetical protein CEXT_629691 [Caerostris extrusa]
MSKVGKSVRNGARKNSFVSDRRRINCCGADKKTVKVEELVLCCVWQGVGKSLVWKCTEKSWFWSIDIAGRTSSSSQVMDPLKWISGRI